MFAEIDGVKTPRPKEQDIKPKVFNHTAWPLAMIAFSEPTDRYVLWFIRNYKYAFNVFYTSDFIQWMKPPDGDKSKWPLYKYQLTVKSLMDRHLIKHGDNKRLTLVLTNKGKLFRLTTHPGWPVIPVLFAAIVAFTIFGLNRGCIKEKTESGTEAKSINQIDDSSQYIPSQTVPLKGVDSSLIDSGKAKIKHN